MRIDLSMRKIAQELESMRKQAQENEKGTKKKSEENDLRLARLEKLIFDINTKLSK